MYQTISLRYQEERDYDKSLEYFQKCLDASQRAADRIMEAECYQKIGKIYEKLEDLPKSIEFLQKFLDLSEEAGDKAKAGEAHKQLAKHTLRITMSSLPSSTSKTCSILQTNSRTSQHKQTHSLNLVSYTTRKASSASQWTVSRSTLNCHVLTQKNQRTKS